MGLFVGLLREDAATIALALAAIVSALIVVWVGVARVSGSSQGHGHG